MENAVFQESPVPSGYLTWADYWTALGMPWRTEPPIDEARRQYLTACRDVRPHIKLGVYPFRDEGGGIALNRADVEWLLATHESDGMVGPLDWKDPAQRKRVGLDLRGALLTGEDLTSLPLARLQGGLVGYDKRQVSEHEQEMAALHLQGTTLSYAHLEEAVLAHCHLEGAALHRAHLEGANLYGAHLEADSPADLHTATFDANSNLGRVTLANRDHVGPRCLSVRWNDVILTAIDWSTVHTLDDESQAKKRKTSNGETISGKERLKEFDRAVQAYRQLAVALSSQGLNEHANRFVYRAHRCQGIVLRRQHRFLRYLGSKLLWLIAGYGYRPMRSFIAYMLVILTFAGAFFALATGLLSFGSADAITSPLAALVFSVTSFHGRGFFPGEGLALDDPITVLAALEAIVGLFIEITFIATFTQRFFAR
jgi:Pentapeptide repeats (8 copies)